MKELNTYKCICLILLFLAPFFGLVKAQTCDPNILKALSETRVTYFDKVTTGQVGSLSIKYPIDGVTYTFTDQGGTSFSYTHSGGSNSVDVPVGVVNAERKFALKAKKGACVYQTSFIYKLTPITSLGIAVRIEHEWCNGAGALYYKIVGGDTSKYNFYHRLQGGAYAGIPSPVGEVTTLTAGTYEVKAEPKAGSGAPAVAPISGLQIRSLKQTVDYTLTNLPSKCTGQLPGLRVNVTSGSYPLLFSLYDNTGTTPVPGFYRQTSNVFTNVPPGNYKVKVEDFCAISGGAATVKDHLVPNTMIDFTETYLNTMQEYGCDYLSFNQLGIKGDNLRAAFEAGSLPFPFTLKFELKEPAPSTTVHTVSRTFNNQNDVSLFLYAHPYATGLLLVKENLRGERIPKKAGQWEIKAIVSACGVNKTLTAKTVTFKSLFDDFAVREGGASETTACHSTNIVLTNNNRMDMSLDIYVVVDQAPAGFKYEEAGFFKLNTSNPLLHNKYVKKMQYYGAANNAYPIVAPEFISQGDQFKFRVVDAECDPNRNSGELPLTITHPTNNEPTDLWIHNTQSCRGVTSTGAPYGTFLFSRTRGSEITEIKILSFDGNPSDLPFTLPYTLPTSNRIDSNTWALYDLPAGKYDISITNRCGNTKLWPNQKLFGETFSFTWSEGCTPSLTAIIGQPEVRAYQSYSVSYFVQHFENGEWKDVERINLNTSALSTSYNKAFTETRLKEGKFRVLRRIRSGEHGKTCDIVVSEKEYIGDLKNPTAIGAGCPNGKYHIAIIANGGTPPYTYEWVSTTPVGSTTPVPSGHPAQTNDNFFVDLTNSDPNTTYTFAVTDACGNRRTVDTNLAGVDKPQIVPDAGRNAFYCTGQQATLSLSNIKGITVKWYRSDAPSTILGIGNSLAITVAPDDFVTGNTYKVELEMPSKPDVASCISDAINTNFAYQFKSKSFVTPTPPTRKDITICAENNTTQDLTQLFQNIPTLSSGVTATIREKTGAIYVPDNNTITIGNMKGEYTFVYTLYEPCRKVIGTPVEATLTVNRKINPNTKQNIKICDPSITMDQLKSQVLAGSPEVLSLALDFHWYQNNTDAQNQQNESAGSYAISLSPGQKKTVYVRYSKLGYCSGEPKAIEVEREASVAPKALTNPDCSVTTVRTLKALVDPVDSANVIIYKNGTEIGDDMLIDEYSPTMYTYSKRLFQCTPPAQLLTFSYKERTVAAPQQVAVCTFPGYQNAPSVKVADIKSKIQAQYVGKTIRIYENNSELNATTGAVYFTSVKVTFTVEETGKCPSLQQKVTLQQAPFSVATPLPALSICEDTTIAELKAEIGAQGFSNVRIYSSSLATEEADDKFVVWGNPYYYRVVETGKCPSEFIPLTFTNRGNKTDATPRRFEVCIAQSATARVSDLKATITGGDVRIFKRNNNNTWSDPLRDNEAVNENDAYFYTLRASGKCPSDKTPLILAITRKTATPSAPTAGTFCTGATIADLKDYIDNTPQNVGTLLVYANNTDTTPITNTTALTNNTTYYFSLQDTDPTKCESDRRALLVTLVAKPTVNATYTYCAGTKLETLWDDIDANDSDRSLKFYENASGGTALARNVVLRAGNYYVAESSTNSALGNCETSRVQLKVVLTKVTAITADLSTTEVKYCKNHTSPAALSVTAEGTGKFTYIWYKAINTTETGTVVRTQANVTANQDTYTPATDTVGTAYYYVVVKSDCGDDKASQRAKITIQSLPAITTQPATLSKPCKDSTLTLSIAHTGDGTRSVQWYKNTSNSNTGGTAISGETANTFTVPTSTVGTTYYYAVVSSNTGCTPAVSSVAEVIVQSLPVITTQPVALSKPCKDSTMTLSIAHTGDGIRLVQWYKNTSNSNTGGTAISGEIANTFTVPTSIVGTTYYYAVVSSDTACTPAVSNVAEVVVTEPTAIDTNLNTTEKKYCKDDTTVLDLLIKAKGTAPFTYKWYKAANAADVGTLVRTEANTNNDEDSYTPVVTTIGTAYYYVVVSSACGSDVTSVRSHITVTESTAIDTDLSTAEVKYCKGETSVSPLLIKAKGTPPFTYQWHKVDAVTLADVIVRTELSTTVAQDTYTPETTTIGTSYYYVEVHSDCGADKISQRTKVTIQDITTKPALTAVNLCQGATVADLKTQLALTLTGTLKVYATLTDPANLVDTTVLNATTYYYTATQIGKCESDRQAIVVTLVQRPTPQAAYAYCTGTTVDTLWKAIDANDSDNSIRIYNVATGGTPLTRTNLLSTATYYVAETASNGGVVTCETTRVVTQVTIGSVANPVIATTPATCGVATVAKVTNRAPGISYTITDNTNTTVAGTSVAADGTIGGITEAGTYKIKATQGTCTSGEVTFTIANALPVPATPTVAVAPPTCTLMSAAKVSNYTDYTHGETFVITDSNGTVVGTVNSTGNITGLTTAGTYTLTIKRGTCSAAAVDFDIADKLPTPAKPVVTLTPASCTSPTVAKITNYVSGQTYWNGSTQLIVNTSTHEIIGLATGTYTITAKSTNNCESLASASFVIKAKKVATTTTNPTGATYVKGATTIPLTVTATGEGTLRYQWFVANSATATGTAVGSNSPSYTPFTATVGSKFYYVEVTGTCGKVKSAVAEIKVTAPATTIEANNDPNTSVAKGGEVDVLSNDKVNGNPATPASVDITIPNDGGLIGVGVNPVTGKIKVPTNSRPGTYTITYQICVHGVTSPCATAKAIITVTPDPTPTIEAKDDADKTVRQGEEVEVLSNDKVNGNPATPASVDITIPNDGGLTGVGVNPITGKIKVPTNARPGTYTITYQICVKGATSPCATAKVKITVATPTRAIKAIDDNFGKIPNALDYTTVATVFSSGVDTMEGVVGNLSPERDVILTPGAQPHANITMNANGSITIKRGTPKGTYSYEYTICQKDVPTNCDRAKVTFEVLEAHILAKDDGVWEVGTEGALTPSVLNNDILGEKVGISFSKVTITKTNGKPVIDDTKMVMNEDGRISVRKNIPEDTYTYYYTITEKANIANSSSAVVTIKVVKFSAQDDEFELINDKTKENKTKSVLENDELNKKKNPSPVNDVILTKGEAKDGERKPTTALTMNEDGTITIAPNTPDGVYTYTYTICKKSAPIECKSAEAVIKLLPTLVAEDDDFSGNPINPLIREGIAGNVLDNDRYANGKSLEHLDKVVIKMLDNQNSRAHIEPNGDVVIPRGAPAGEYTLTYNLCMKDHQTICDEAKVKIVILEDKPLVIHNGISANGDGQNDGFTIENIEGYPKNNLKIFNRWGVLVYEKDGYTNSEPFDGHSNGRATMNAGSKLPQGTYYYILEYQDTAEQTHTEKGWLYLKY